MKTKQEIRDWILENCVDSYGDIILNNLDFGDKNIYLSFISAGSICNLRQRAKKMINNAGQESENIYNNKQKAEEINNNSQKSNKIANCFQEAKKIYT